MSNCIVENNQSDELKEYIQDYINQMYNEYEQENVDINSYENIWFGLEPFQ